MCPRPLQVDLLTLKVVSESHVTWPTSVPILVFLGLSVLDLGPMYTTDRRRETSDAHHHLMPPPYCGRGTTSTGRYLGSHEGKCVDAGVEVANGNADCQ